MVTAMIIILIIISAILIVLSILMAPDSMSASGALVGSSDIDLFTEKKTRGAKKWITRLMFIFGIALMIAAILLKVYI